jgi:hypothetical protein
MGEPVRIDKSEGCSCTWVHVTPQAAYIKWDKDCPLHGTAHIDGDANG